MISRRKFLTQAFAATAGGILVAKDLVSTKSFFLPPRGGWMRFVTDTGPVMSNGSIWTEIGNELWNGARILPGQKQYEQSTYHRLQFTGSGRINL